MTKLLPCRIKQSFGFFNKLSVDKYSAALLFRRLSNPTIWNLQCQREITKFYVDSGEPGKILENIF